jgi:Bacterial Ig domain
MILSKRYTIIVRLAMTLLAMMLVACSSQTQSSNTSDLDGLEPQTLPVTGRKLLEYGWDVPGAEFVRDNIRTVEQQPFNGVVMTLEDVVNDSVGRPSQFNVPWAFDTTPWTEADMKLPALSAIKWQKFTDNFILVWATNYGNMNWFDDSQWTTIEANMRLLSKALKAMRGKGIFFDVETYDGLNPWSGRDANGNTLYPGKSYAQIKAKVRQRGAQFMNGLQSEVPNLQILCTFLMAYVQQEVELRGSLEASYIGLLQPFLEGMLDAAGPNVRIYDSNESAYYYTETGEFYKGHSDVDRAVRLIAPELQSKYRRQVPVANAVYADLALGQVPALDLSGRPFYGRPPYYDTFTAQDFSKWWQHHLYQAYTTSDRYVWVYADEMTWWNDPTFPNPGIFPNAKEGIISVQSKLAQAQPLGYDMVKRNIADPAEKPRFLSSPKVSLSASLSGNSISLTATTTGAGIQRVEFYQSTSKISTDTSAPYTFNLTNLSVGNRTFVARVFTATSHGTSAPIDVRVTQ